MKKSLLAGLFAIISMVAAPQPVAAQVVPDEVVVKFKPGVAFANQTFLLRRTLGLKTRRIGYLQAHIVVEVPKGTTQASLVALLKAQPPIAIAEPNGVTVATSVQPNDLYYFAAQWNLQSIGGYGIRCDQAWSISRGEGVGVAVLDTGCAFETRNGFYAAPDLDTSNIIPMTDWVNGDVSPNDDNGHGTFMCSVIGEKMNNRIGGAGIAPDAILLPGKVLDQNARGKVDWMVNGINEAVNKGASIILLGGGTQSHSQLLQSAISDAVARGSSVVIGAGNNGANLDTNPGAWALYAGAVTVGASTRDGLLAPYSNYASSVRLIAPGGTEVSPIWAQTFVLSDSSLPRYGFDRNGNTISWRIGTSVAAAHAAGVMALRQALYGNRRIEDGARPLLLSPGAVTREFLLVDAAGAVGIRDGSGGEGGGGGPAEVRDVGVEDLLVPPGGVRVGDVGTVSVVVRNFGFVDESVTVTLRDATTGQTVGSELIDLPQDETATVEFTWAGVSPVGTHTLEAEVIAEGDMDPTNNTLSRSAQVLSQPFAMRTATYSPNAGDPTNGTPQNTFLGGQLIGVEFLVTDDSAPAVGASVAYRAIGANGSTVGQGTLTTNGSGRATTLVGFYYTTGGPGAYRIESTATKAGKSISDTYTFQVTSPRGGR